MNFALFLVVGWHVARAMENPFELLPNYNFPLLNFGNRNMGDFARITESEISFSLKLYKTVAALRTDPIILSTADVFQSLSKLRVSASGSSEQQLNNILHHSPEYSATERGLLDLVYRMNDLRRTGISLNNEIFHSYESGLKPSFEHQMLSMFGSKPQEATCWDNITNGNAIYEWAKAVGIEDPYKQTFEEEESLVLTSAAMFSSKFDVSSWYKRYSYSAFYYNNELYPCSYFSTVIKVNYGEINYRRDSDNDEVTGKYVGLTWATPYKDRIKTFLILPNEIDDIADLEQSIDETTIQEMLSNTVTDWVVIKMPMKISTGMTYNLIDALKIMGLTEIFDETTDFGNITETHSIKVGAVLHQAKISDDWIWEKLSIYPVLPVALKVFTASHTFMTVTVLMDENPFIISMGRHECASK